MSKDVFEKEIKTVVAKDDRLRCLKYARFHGWLRKLKSLLDKGRVWYFTTCKYFLDAENVV